MRIGYVLKEFPRLSETFILTEILALERLGCEVTAFSRYRPVDGAPHGAVARLGAETIVLEPWLRERFWEPFALHRELARSRAEVHEAVFDTALAHRNREEMRYWLLASVVALEARRRKLDYLHGHFATGSASVARYAGRLAGIPFGFTAHAKDIYANDVDHGRLRGLLRDASVTVAISEANREFLLDVEPTARVVRNYNGLDLGSFPLRAPRPPADPPLVLFVSRFVEKKGIPVLLDAVARLKERGLRARVRLVGDGPLEGAARERVRALGLGEIVEFAGVASQEEIVDRHLGEADLFVLPCVVAADGDRDGIPTTLLEAMARGVPVVSTRVSGIPEAVVDRVTGLLVDANDAEGLAMAIVATLADRHATSERIARAREHTERRFDAARNAPALLKTFEGAIRRGVEQGVES